MVLRLVAFSLLCVSVFGEVRLAQLLTEHMVLQRKMPVHIWGFGSPGEPVTATFRGETRRAATDDSGRWSVWFSPVTEAGGPFELVVKGPSKTIRLSDVLSGDVWIVAGQSNMEWPVAWAANPEPEKQAANYPRVRLARTMHRVRDYPVDDFVGTAWEPCSPASVENFSAVGYHFARILHAKLNVPIGVIQTAWGGTPAEAWTSLRGIAADASLMPIFQEWARVEEQHQTELHRHRYRLDDWARAAAKARDTHHQPPEKPELRTGPGGPWTPAGLFNGMVAPLTAFPIKGVIWYQGESNTSPERAPLYERLFPALIQDWRRAWQQGDFSFLFVQLANFNAAAESMWPEVREAQRHALQLRNTAMVVAIDAGTPGDIHPRNKRIIAERLSIAARAVAYGEESLDYSGPLFRKALIEGPRLRLLFEHPHGLTLRSPGSFEVAGQNGRFVPATAQLDGDTVLVSSPDVNSPRYVRYAWADNPTPTLFNTAGLPASPFRTKR